MATKTKTRRSKRSSASKASEAVAEMDLEDLAGMIEDNEQESLVDVSDVEVADELDETTAGEGETNDADETANEDPKETEPVYQHVTAVRCPRCNTPMRTIGTRMVGDGNGGKKQLKRWVCPCAVCRKTHETVARVI